MQEFRLYFETPFFEKRFMNRRLILVTEVLKFAAAIFITLILKQYIFKGYEHGDSLDIHFHDTYVVMDNSSLYLLLIIPVYYLVQLLHLSFARRIQLPAFILFLICAVLFSLLFYQFHQLFLFLIHLYQHGGIWWGNYGLDENVFDFKYIYLSVLFLALSSLWICIKFGIQKRRSS